MSVRHRSAGHATGGVIRRRLILGSATAGATSAAVMLAACGVGGIGPATAPARAAVTIEYLTSLSARQQDNHQQLIVDAFAKANVPVQVRVSQWDRFPDKLVTLLAGGTPPDVTWFTTPSTFLNKLTQDITPYVRRDRYNTGVFTKEPFEALSVWRGKNIGLPNQSGGNWPVMPYNKEVLQRAGVPEPPTRWNDARWTEQAWLDSLQRCVRTGAVGINLINANTFAKYWSTSWKAAWLTDDFKTITCDSAAMIEATQYLVDLITRHQVMTTGAEGGAIAAVIAGQQAMLVTSGLNTAQIAQAVREQNRPLAFAPLPTFKVGGAYQQVDNNGIVTGAKHPEEAWVFVKWSAETPNWALSRGNAPARADHFDAWARELYPGIGPQIQMDVYKDSLRFAAKIDPLFILPNWSQMVSEVISPAYARLIAGQASPATTLREIKGPLQALVPKDLG